jgi:hypothetical protein
MRDNIPRVDINLVHVYFFQISLIPIKYKIEIQIYWQMANSGSFISIAQRPC